MLLRNTAIGLTFGLVGALSVNYLCTTPAGRKKKAKHDRRRTQRKRAEQRRLELDSDSDSDSDDFPVPASASSSPASCSSSSSEELQTPVKSNAKLTLRSVSGGSQSRERTPAAKSMATPAKRLEWSAMSPNSLSRERTLLENVLSKKESSDEYGEFHRRTILSKWNLADLLQSQYGDLDRACELVEECIVAAKRNPDMGAEHADTKRYQEYRREWASLRRQRNDGQIVFRPWSPEKQDCWVQVTES